MTPPLQSAVTVETIEDCAPDVRILTVRAPDGFSFVPGQYVFLSGGGHAPRAYSIAGAPENGLLEFHVKRAHDGGLSAYLHALAAGADIFMDGPHGDSTLALVSEKPIVAVAGGLGITPIKAVIEDLLDKNPTARVTLIVGVRQNADFYLRDYFNRLAAQHPHFNWQMAVSDEAALPPAFNGLAGEAVSAYLQNSGVHDCAFYVAGPAPMAADVITRLRNDGVPAAHIFSDFSGYPSPQTPPRKAHP